MKRSVWLCVVAALGVPAPLLSQEVPTRAEMEALRERVQSLERQNQEFQEQLRLVRLQLEKLLPGGPADAPAETRLEALEEKVDLQAGRLMEHERVKMESLSRAPVRLSGIVLLNAFSNTRHGNNGTDFPRFASLTSNSNGAGANFRQSVIGLEFQSPDAILGGQFRGAIFADFFNGLDTLPTANVLAMTPRLRTAWIEGEWKTRGILFGQERPIFVPREPASLAHMGHTPLVAAGDLYTWEPQIRFEQKLKMGSREELRLRLGAVQTSEDQTDRGLAAQFTSLVAKRRPGIEGHLQFAHRFDDFRRFEIATGFHRSTTHVVGLAAPSEVVSIDWFYNPHRRVEFTGTVFRGQNLYIFGGGGIAQGFTVTTLRPGVFQVTPVRSQGGWAQMTLVATPRLSFNISGGSDDPNNRDLPLTGIARNRVWVGNLMFRVAPNVVIAPEFSQARTMYIIGGRALNNHYDLAVAYFF